MKKQDFAKRLINASHEIKAIEEELNEIDAHFGDADHGLTMAKIAGAIEEAASASEGSIRDMVSKCSEGIDGVGGGAAVPLWSSWFTGMIDGAPDADETDIKGIQEIFAAGFEMLDFMSGAQVGDKTLMDAAIPASEAIASFDGTDENELFAKAAAAADEGAQNTKNFKSKFGRAKYFGDKTIGTPDAGALSMAAFFKGLAV